VGKGSRRSRRRRNPVHFDESRRTKKRFCQRKLAQLADTLKIPIIASGGAGAKEHFLDVFTKGKADAGLAASIFHYNEIPVPILKSYLKENGIVVR
jgi:cyclase